MCVSMCKYVYTSACFDKGLRSQILLSLELQAVVSYLLWMLGIQFWVL